MRRGSQFSHIFATLLFLRGFRKKTQIFELPEPVNPLNLQMGNKYGSLMNRVTSLYISVLILSFNFVQANWNLPYIRPAAYDYSEYYGPDLIAYQASSPTGFANELKKAWGYYKTAFMLSNGLVNHMKWNPSSASVQGTNEAVSEGQGYGMLLAVLMNDQATFNKIFEASNQHMWDNGHKSYFIWNWPGGGSGSATDADLDIGLALVFADELQKKGLWAAYSGPVSYNARAMDVIKSLRQNMTQNDYLLPGDNWGGDALNNLNPSYFAVAWLKVFNAYQNEVDFTAVINKCYQVLELMPHYNKGQAADWITTNGGRGSRGDRGMGNDAIRTPFRIAMDALWFNEPRAIKYLKNTKLTLSNYNTSVINLLGQMGLYTEQGTLIGATKAQFHIVAMWASGILGSKDKTYTQPSFQGRLIAQITGTSRDYFGDQALHDHQFYYNQSLAMFGFAAITGQFPNILADMQGPVETGIPLLTPLASNVNTAFFPQNITFTATIEKAAAWTLTLTGQSSGITKEYNGTGKDISVVWNGVGFNQVELVTAQLQVAGLESQPDPNVLKYNVQVMGPNTSHVALRTGKHLKLNMTQTSLELIFTRNNLRLKSLEIYNSKGELKKIFKSASKTSEGWKIPTHGLTGEGIYLVKLTVTDGLGKPFQIQTKPQVLMK